MHLAFAKIAPCCFEIIFKHDSNFYSVLKLFTGLAIAAFIAWKLTVINAIATDIKPAIANTHQSILTRYEYDASQLFITHHATGDEITNEIRTSFRKSFDNNAVILCTLAPSTLRMPISFIRVSAI